MLNDKSLLSVPKTANEADEFTTYMSASEVGHGFTTIGPGHDLGLMLGQLWYTPPNQIPLDLCLLNANLVALPFEA